MGFELPLSTELGGWVRGLGGGVCVLNSACLQEGLCCTGKPLILPPALPVLQLAWSTKSICLYCTKREQDAPEEENCS